MHNSAHTILHLFCVLENLMIMGKEVGGSGWGTHVHSWRIQVNVWQNQYNIVK